MSAASHSVPSPVKQQPSLAPTPAPVQPAPDRPWKWLFLFAALAAGAYFGYRAFVAKSTNAIPVVAVKSAKVTVGNLQRTFAWEVKRRRLISPTLRRRQCADRIRIARWSC